MNDSHRQIAALMVAANAGYRMRATLEFTMVVTIVTILIAVAAAGFERYITVARMAEAFSLTSTVRSDLVAYRAEHGYWPATAADLGNPTAEDQERLGQYVDEVEVLPHAGFSVHFNENSGTISGKQLVFHAATVGSSGSSPISWFCRRKLVAASVPAGARVGPGGPNEISLFVCR